MTKVSAYAISMALMTHMGRRVAAECPAGSVASIALDTCDLASFTAGLQGGCTVDDLFGNATVAEQEAEIDELCKYVAPTQFVEMSQYYQSDRLFFQGGGEIDWAADRAQATEDLARFERNTAGSSIISYPNYEARVEYNRANELGDNGMPPDLNIEAQCDLNTIMCCYIDDSYGDDFPADKTTDVCHHDLANSRESNHIRHGWSVFTGSETSTYCAGFTWSEDEQDTALLGNALYGASYRTVLQKGYIGNIPGAPLCGCVESMPVVEKAECTKATAADVKFTFSVTEEGELTADNEAVISYESCGDLKTEAVAKGNAGIEEHLVGDGGCESAIQTFLRDEELSSLGTSERSKAVDETIWGELFLGEGTYFQPPGLNRTELDTEFRALVEAGCWDEKDGSGNKIVRPCMIYRRCNQCSQPTHYDIVYKRYTPLPTPDQLNFVDYFMNHFYHDKPASKHKVDFDLFSSYEDALAGENAWQYCPTNNYWGIGFPYECGPVKRTYNQYSAYEIRRNWGHANHHGFWVEQPKAE